MRVLIEYPLPPNNFVEVKTLNVGDGFLRVGGPYNATQADFWILQAKDDATPTISMLNPTDMSLITGVANNMPVVPYPAVVVPLHLSKQHC